MPTIQKSRNRIGRLLADTLDYLQGFTVLVLVDMGFAHYIAISPYNTERETIRYSRNQFERKCIGAAQSNSPP